jgi:uncharacterized metal-binding protein YceD (DUF177 family)
VSDRPPQSELERPFDLAHLNRDGPTSLAIEASAPERAAIAARLGILAIDKLKSDLQIMPEGQDGIVVSGVISAAVVQNCVVSLEPLEAAIAEPFAVHFAGPGAAPQGPEEDVDLEAPDPPESLPASGVIPLGELIIQHLALALDPYPRKPGAHFVHHDEAGATPESPFAKLAALKPDRKSGQK